MPPAFSPSASGGVWQSHPPAAPNTSFPRATSSGSAADAGAEQSVRMMAAITITTGGFVMEPRRCGPSTRAVSWPTSMLQARPRRSPPTCYHPGLGERRPRMDTGYTLDQFLADTRATIKTKGVPPGLAEIRDHLEKLLRNPELLKKHMGDPVPYKERTTIGHDPETDVHVLVHGREKGGKSVPHDHGPCWVIYGNYKNPTRMRRWRRLDDGSKPGHAELELQRDFMNEAGHAAVFAVGDIHSIEYGDDTFFIRVTGGDVESQKTLRFDLDKKSVQVADRAPGPAVVGPRRAARRQRSGERT